MRKKLLTAAFAGILTLVAAVPMLGPGGVDAHPGHRSCAGGAAALKGVLIPVGPGNNGIGDAASAAAQDGGGAADEVADLHAAACDPAP